MLRDKINDGMKDAMKSQDKLRLSTLRLVNAAIKNADIEARGAGKDPLDDAALLGLLQKMIKQREESVTLYEKGGRKELADQERGEDENREAARTASTRMHVRQSACLTQNQYRLRSRQS